MTPALQWAIDVDRHRRAMAKGPLPDERERSFFLLRALRYPFFKECTASSAFFTSCSSL